MYTDKAGSPLPTHYLNILPDLPGGPAPVLHPATHEPVTPNDLSPLFPDALIEQEMSMERMIEIPKEVLDSLDGFYADAVAGGLYDPNGGGEKAALADMEWYSAAGQLTGDPKDLKIEDFWYLKPLESASQ